jgi:hypothetical protein
VRRLRPRGLPGRPESARNRWLRSRSSAALS